MKTTKFLLSLGILASLGMLASCADDDLANGGGKEDGDRGTAVTFTVSDAQDDAQKAMFAPVAGNTRAFGGEVTRVGFTNALSMQGLTPEDLTTQKLPVQGGDGSTCLVETTVAGVNPVKHTGAQTRANISTAITDKFSSIGYRGTSAAGISTTPWFHNKETNADGTLVEDIRWMWAQPYGRFYGISPQVTTAYNKLTVSDASYTSTPYVEFEVEQDVKKQKDLMTACSGVVHYATQFVAPETNLRFRHALTAVRFKVGSNLSWNKTINKVEIIGAKSKGKYTLPTDETGAGAGWSDQSAPQTFTLGGDGTVSVSTSAAVNQIIMGNTGDNYTFYMIPQSLSGVSVKIYFADGSTPISVNLSGTWKPGTTKTYALSQNTSTWQYQLTVTDPTPAAYNATTAASYTVQSYRTDLATGTQQPVKWKVVGYDGNGDGTYSMTDKPSWLTSLSKEEGDGGTAAEAGTATLVPAHVIDLLAARNNALKSATALGSAGNPYDLSTKGGSVARSTANSYVISAPGHYSIPLVYGNAITSGATNSHAYTSSASGTYVLQHFKDHADHDITDPWITQSNSGANAPDNAKVVWADESGLVTNLSVTGSGSNAFVKFDVPASAIKNGNAVIAVTKGGTVVWSWHLWFAPQDVLNTTAVTNFQNKVYNFTNETLGLKYTSWVGTTYTSPRSVKVKVEQTVGQAGGKQVGYITITQNNGSVRQGYSTLYQFGRKDAFPGTDTTPDGSFNKNGGDNMSIQNGIQHPEIFYTWGPSWSNNPPSGYSYYNLWSMENSTTGWNDNAVVKTIYDPCPAGFKMPASNAFTGFTTTGNYSSTPSEFNVSGDWDNGWNFKGTGTHTVYFPASGYRSTYDGSLSGVGSIGYYWSAVPYNTNSGCRLYFSQWYVRPQNGSRRSYGLSVRPVSE
ncbi:fimbrillin family protein [Alloprevotella sp. OH1205_COT-284]|uniref:fimbrillin family protein n=1 Tax=Alloprevotella sp. OH1205_COT-284 TaxID=2491043 RepID=UPI000F5EF712|nr:fimbrillin family protein [Alloprevotella sp. OH1205_COT-284]RRD75198.1 fimbrillin family protein [Alloprevotella sp. OH1205_COT-284]